MVSKRLVFFFPGFEPFRATGHMERFRRAAARTAQAYEVAIEVAPETAPPAGEEMRPSLDMRAHAPGSFDTRTTVVFCDWGDVILDYAARPVATRLLDGVGAMLDFVVTGTLFRYMRTSWRYALFFAFPLLALFGPALLAVLLAILGHALLPGGVGLLLGLGLGAALAALLWRLALTRLHLLTALDDWALARDLCRGRNAALERRIGEHCDALALRLCGEGADEIVVAAHSLGASLAVRALSRALKAVRPGADLQMLTVGSSLMKTALHPAAAPERDCVRHLVEEVALPWTDCQALSDPINFYKSNPATSLGIAGGARPIVRRVHFKRLVSAQTYTRIKRDFFRLHRQFVLGVERRNPYSFHMLLLGPNPIPLFSRTGTVDLAPLPGAPAASPSGAPR
ncbi:hypothetical protein [Aurantimonas sp. Leaf443]|uniref:hypothetical protein n=1 Tax=Aurantimonas sp. Leaf443 TaxID=1736378 RepID=UPI0006F5E89C|nr:hypothetical protein [Aurantimonas sp. Leaf443]KQT85449.1 hypothetical protein ASG48_09455 [Aurantimonas sp. Leaf443]